MNDDDNLLRQIADSAKRGHDARVPPLDELTRARIAREIAQGYPPVRTRARRLTMYRRLTAATGVVALAATVLLVLRPPTRGDGAAGDLPAYELAVTGGARDVRGEPAPDARGPLRLRKGDRFEATLRPPQATAGPVAAQAFLERDREVIAFRGAIDVAPKGTVRVGGTVEDFPGVTPGGWQLVVVVGRPEALAGARDAIRESGRAGLQVKRAAVTVE